MSDKKRPSVFTKKGVICINIAHKMYLQTQKASATMNKWYIADLIGTELSSKLPIPKEYQDDVPSIGKYIIMMKKEFADKVTEYWF